MNIFEAKNKLKAVTDERGNPTDGAITLEVKKAIKPMHAAWQKIIEEVEL